MDISSDIEAAVKSRCKMVIRNLTIANITEVRCICKLISQNYMYILINILKLCHTFCSQVCWLNKSKISDQKENCSNFAAY